MVEWSILRLPDKDDLLSFSTVEWIQALLQDEVHGKAAERAVYNVFWQALLRSSELRKWVEEHFLRWWGGVEEIIEEILSRQEAP
mgnify:FL=1